MYEWGQAVSWATLALGWLMAFAIGIAIYLLPIARLLDSLTGESSRLAPMPWQVVPATEGVSSFDATVLPRPLQMGDNMVEVLKFSRETAFTPETIQILAAALDEAWERLRQSGSRLTRPAYSRAMREVVAKRIMEMAQRGVQDREALVADALRFVTTNYEESSKLTN